MDEIDRRIREICRKNGGLGRVAERNIRLMAEAGPRGCTRAEMGYPPGRGRNPGARLVEAGIMKYVARESDIEDVVNNPARYRLTDWVVKYLNTGTE